MSRKDDRVALICSVIRRFSLGSLMLRGWSVLVVGALLAISTQRVHARFAWLSLFIAIAFWILDAYLLQQATLFRRLGQRVQNLTDEEVLLDSPLDTTSVVEPSDAFGTVFFSTILVIFYGLLTSAIAGAIAFFNFVR